MATSMDISQLASAIRPEGPSWLGNGGDSGALGHVSPTARPLSSAQLSTCIYKESLGAFLSLQIVRKTSSKREGVFLEAFHNADEQATISAFPNADEQATISSIDLQFHYLHTIRL